MGRGCNGLLGGLRLLPWVATVVEGGIACWSKEKGGSLGPRMLAKVEEEST